MTLKRSVARLATRTWDALDTGPVRPPVEAEMIRLYWWNEAPNFGDALSADVVRWLSRVEVAHAGISDCNMIAVGSIYSWLKMSLRRRKHAVHVWGSGTLRPEPGLKADRGLIVDAVRGPLTAWATGRQVPVMGDPGLLADRVFGLRKSETSDRPGLMLHHLQRDHADGAMIKALGERYELIDPRNNNAREVCEQIASCSSMFSSSLHGLVIADALGIPNQMVEPVNFTGNRLDRAMYKFVDYALAIDRVLNHPLRISDLDRTDGPTRQPDYMAGLDQIKDALQTAFPAQWRRADLPGDAVSPISAGAT